MQDILPVKWANCRVCEGQRFTEGLAALKLSHACEQHKNVSSMNRNRMRHVADTLRLHLHRSFDINKIVDYDRYKLFTIVFIGVFIAKLL